VAAGKAMATKSTTPQGAGQEGTPDDDGHRRHAVSNGALEQVAVPWSQAAPH